MIRSTRDSARALASIAQNQGGYFTAKQAQAVGYGYSHIKYHESTGTFVRVDHGLYHLATAPVAEHDELIRLSLWSRNRSDEPQAVVSHESALVLHELTELLPDRTHLTVPTKFRKRVPRGVTLHRGNLVPGDIEERDGYRATTPLRTLLDAARDGTSHEQLGKAVRAALARGLVRRGVLDQSVKSTPGTERLLVPLERGMKAKS